MIINHPIDLPPGNPDAMLVDFTQSLPVAIARGMGAPIDNESLVQLFQSDEMVVGSGFLNGRWAIPVGKLAGLQKAANTMAYDGQKLAAKDWGATTGNWGAEFADSITALAAARGSSGRQSSLASPLKISSRMSSRPTLPLSISLSMTKATLRRAMTSCCTALLLALA